jgi:anti-anti-sigma regulatory factor
MGPDKNLMQITTLDIPRELVLAVSGRVGPAQMPELRTRLVDAIDRTDGDVLIDTHHVTAFDDTALVALTAARKRAKFLRHRIAILDAEDSPVALSLRRTGMHIRLPVYPDAATAAHHLAADRAARARLTLHQHALAGQEYLPGGVPEAGTDRRKIARAG